MCGQEHFYIGPPHQCNSPVPPGSRSRRNEHPPHLTTWLPSCTISPPLDLPMVLSHLGCTQCISRKRALLILGLKSPSTSFQCSCPCPCPFSASGDLSKDVASEMGADFSAMPSTVSGLDDINRDDWILTLPQLLFPHRHFTCRISPTAPSRRLTRVANDPPN